MNSLTVEINEGIIKGCVGTSRYGEQFLKFLGIPYAKPPLGDLRFKDPLPPEKFDGIKDCTTECDLCYSLDEVTRTVHGTEDCLYLNVFTKKLPEKNDVPKPVMVWIHGGAFLRGSISEKSYGAEFLLSEDIVLVTIQYRLGALGFLRLKNPSLGVLGNFGLKDQNQALKWIQANIANFNGDPNNVTLFGQSAGGTSVNHHILSPHSKGLFQKAILQSGCALKGWDECMHDAIELARIIDQTVETENKALEVLKKAPVEQLYRAQETYIKESKIGAINKMFGPEFENNESDFIRDRPIDVILSEDYNKVPIMIGYTNREGLLYDYYKILNPNLSLDVDSAIPQYLNLKLGSGERKTIENKLKEFYFGADQDEGDALRLLLSDTSYISGLIAAVLKLSSTSDQPHYLYRVSLDTSLNFLKQKTGITHLYGTCHADELGYLFKTSQTPQNIQPGSLEDISIKRLVKLWSNFAKYGNPTPDAGELGVLWKPFRSNNQNFLDIGDKLTMGVNPEADRMEIWKEIYAQSSLTNKFFS